jgi:hypothetical protein
VQGEVANFRQIARLEKTDERYASRILNCALLAPDLVEMISDGRQPAGLMLARIQADLPLDWSEQRRRLASL